VFRDRIQQSAFPLDILTDPVYSSVVTLNPSASSRERVCARSTFLSIDGSSSCLGVPIDAIIDLREHNTSTLWTDGLDIRLGANFETPVGKLGFSIASTYILDYKEADTRDAPLTSLLNHDSNPLALHVVATTTWDVGDAQASLAIRRANGYRDYQTQPASSVASWTTADLRLAYTFNAAAASGAPSTEIAIDCENLLNHYSPFEINDTAHLGYDQENGDLTGRVITLSVNVKW
jgi:hypothetical protein